jgi:hypothetical protein
MVYDWEGLILMHGILTLYHGTTHDFTEIDVLQGKPFKDFGQGFYLTETYKHARNIAIRNRRIEEQRLLVRGDERQLSVFIYIYELEIEAMNTLDVKQFTSPDQEWLKFIILNRMNRMRQHEYDIVIGPTANDDTRASIRAVMNLADGAIMSEAALNLLIEMLEPNNLPEQYYFGSNRAVGMLKLVGRQEIEMNEQKIQFCIDALTADVADKLALELDMEITIALHEFMQTKTYELLFNEKSLLYLESAEYVYDMLQAEQQEDWERWREE